MPVPATASTALVELDNQQDFDFHPGLLLQVQSFFDSYLNPSFSSNLCTLNEQLTAFPFYYRIAGYK